MAEAPSAKRARPAEETTEWRERKRVLSALSSCLDALTNDELTELLDGSKASLMHKCQECYRFTDDITENCEAFRDVHLDLCQRCRNLCVRCGVVYSDNLAGYKHDHPEQDEEDDEEDEEDEGSASSEEYEQEEEEEDEESSESGEEDSAREKPKGAQGSTGDT